MRHPSLYIPLLGDVSVQMIDAANRQIVGNWACYLMKHEISTQWDIPRDLGLAIITPVWMRYVYKRDDKLFAKLATELFNVEYDYDYPERTALAGIDALSEWFQSIGMPKTIREFVKGDTSEEVLWKMARRIDYSMPRHKVGCAPHQHGGCRQHLQTFPIKERVAFCR